MEIEERFKQASMFCGTCSAPVEYPQQYCSQCGTPIDWNGLQPQQPSSADSAFVQNNLVTLQSPQTVQKTERATLLSGWKTSIGYSILGLASYGILVPLLAVLVSNRPQGVPMIVLTIAAVSLVFYFVSMVKYAAKIYPSLFSTQPKLTDNRAISFRNCFYGAFVFGPLWNHALTRKKKGSSNIVFVVLFTTSILIAPTLMAINSISHQIVEILPISTMAQYFHSQQLNPYSFPEQGFIASFPEQPFEKHDSIEAEGGVLIPYSTFVVDQGNLAYSVMVAQYPSDQYDIATSPRDVIYKTVLYYAEVEDSALLEWHNTSELLGNPCATAVYEVNVGTQTAIIRCLVVSRGNSVYSLMTTGISQSEHDSFIESFRFSDSSESIGNPDTVSSHLKPDKEKSIVEQVFNFTTLFHFVFVAAVFLMLARSTEHTIIAKVFYPILLLAGLVWLILYAFATEWYISIILIFCGMVLGFVFMGMVDCFTALLPRIRKLKKERDGQSDFLELSFDEATKRLYEEVHRVQYGVAIASTPIAAIAGILMYVLLLG